MPSSVLSQEVRDAFASASTPQAVDVQVDGQPVRIQKPFPSPGDWRDQSIYFLMVDRFNREPFAPPLHLPFDGDHGVFQGGNIAGIRRRLSYLKDLGVGALWLSPVAKNCQFEDGTYHGYGFQDFLRIDPRFGTEQELQQLIDEAHARGIYIIFDVVLNHAGNVFDYDGFGATAPFRDSGYPVHWRDENGAPSFPDLAQAANLNDDAAVWPLELHRNELFRRKGKGGEAGGDFESLKEFDTGRQDATQFAPAFPVRQVLIRAYQYLIAKFDVDGFRIDTLKFIEPEFARTFGNAMREFALSIGKKNFFTFGEVFDDEFKIAQFIGRNAGATEDPIGVDAALDFPLFFNLPGIAKGFAAPAALATLYERRKQIEKDVITSHGEASSHFVTFLDNHDMRERFYFRDAHGRFDDQLTLGITCLFSLPGIPCLYYGTEQGLSGRGAADLSVREALWGKPNAFDRTHSFYRVIQRINSVRAAEPALRYGRLYFRPVSGNAVDYGVSSFPSGVIAFSRILNEVEVVVVANTSIATGFDGHVIVDATLNPDDAAYRIVFSNKANPQLPDPVATRTAGTVRIQEPTGRMTTGPARTVRVRLAPAEVQILKQR